MRDRTFDSALRLMRSGSSNMPIQRLLKVAQTIADSSAVGLFLSQGDQQTVVASDGIPYSFFRSSLVTKPALPDLFGSPLEIGDTQIEQALSDARFTAIRDRWRWMAGAPVELPNVTGSLALIAFDWSANKQRRPDLLVSLQRVAAVVADELRLIGEIADQKDRRGDLLFNVDCLSEAVDHSVFPFILIDTELRILAVSQSMSDLMLAEADIIRGTSVMDQLSTPNGEIGKFLRRRLKSSGGRQTLNVRADDNHPAFTLEAIHCTEFGSDADVIIVSAASVNTADRLFDMSVDKRSVVAARGEPEGVTCEFLLSTLISNRRIRRRGTTDYHTLTRWRASIKDTQIAALRAIKRSVPALLLDRVATDLSEMATSLFGRDFVRAVCAVPCGHSGPHCLSEQLGRATATKLGLPFHAAFADLPSGGSSHPRTNRSRAAMKLVAPIAEPVLLIDDVATSGAHIDEAARKLKRHAPAVLPIAWIGG